MATKIKMMKLLQEMRGFADMAHRHPQPRSPGLFLLQMRSHLLQTTLAERKRSVPIDIQGPPDIPHPVKIRHVKGSALPAAAVASH